VVGFDMRFAVFGLLLISLMMQFYAVPFAPGACISTDCGSAPRFGVKADQAAHFGLADQTAAIPPAPCYRPTPWIRRRCRWPLPVRRHRANDHRNESAPEIRGAPLFAMELRS
jgi:hypothetical protein